MIYSYAECIKLYGNNYLLKKATAQGEVFKLQSGLYSTKKKIRNIEVFLKKHKNFVFTMESAFYYLGISDVVPNKYIVATDKDATKYKDDDVEQYYLKSGLINIGATTIKHNNVDIPIFNKERMLIEVARYKNKLPFDYYKEVINYYRKHIEEIDIPLVLDYLELFPKKKFIERIIRLEVL